MINARDVNFWYGDFHALKGISMEIEEKSVVAFIGPSGCGKSTFLRLFNRMNDLIPATRLTGEIRINGENIYDKGIEVDELRKNVGMVFQRPNPFPKSIFENVAYALEVIDTPRVEIRRRVRATLELVGLEDKVNAFPHELSGGQQQRVAIARAIVNRPKVLIADEPTGNLDPETSKEIINVLMRINEEQGTTVLVVTHDQKIVQEHKKRTILMEDGCINADTSLGGYDL